MTRAKTNQSNSSSYNSQPALMLADKDPVIAPIDQDDWAKNLGYLV